MELVFLDSVQLSLPPIYLIKYKFNIGNFEFKINLKHLSKSYIKNPAVFISHIQYRILLNTRLALSPKDFLPCHRSSSLLPSFKSFQIQLPAMANGFRSMINKQILLSSFALLGLEYPAGPEHVCRHISPEVANK